MTSALPDHAAFRALRTFASLDGLRCMSIVPVVFHHASGGLPLGRLGLRGFLGVDMFFVISGFLIVTQLLRERECHGQISLSRFYARRALRIMPLYYGIMLGLTVLFGVLMQHSHQSQAFFAELPHCLSYTTNWVPITTMLAITWSLSAEEQFYLLWPPIEKRLLRPVPVLIGLIVLCELVQFRVLDVLLHERLGLARALPMLQITFTPILLGVLLAHLLHEARSFAWLARAVGSRYASLSFYAVLLASLFLMPVDLSGWPRLTLHLTMTLLLASSLVRSDHALAPALQLAPIKRIGVLSYGIYLWHIFAVHGASAGLTRLHAPAFLLFPVALLFAIALAELSYRYYETPFLQVKARFSR